jgi:hypothetical protein
VTAGGRVAAGMAGWPGGSAARLAFACVLCGCSVPGCGGDLLGCAWPAPQSAAKRPLESVTWMGGDGGDHEPVLRAAVPAAEGGL